MRGLTCTILGGAALALVLPAPVGLVRGQEGDEDVRSIRRTIEQVKKSGNSAWEQIPWVATLTEARQLSAKEKRPVFLFTHEGNIRSGRC